jgi:ferredoxin-NADP reductase
MSRPGTYEGAVAGAGTPPASELDPLATCPLLVKQVTWEADKVVSLVLVDPAGRQLREWAPGAHLDVVLPSGLVRQFSLCGDPRALDTYRIAVLREDAGRGGSVEAHRSLLAGSIVEVRGPRNHFALRDAKQYSFFAGGIGITPILPMVRAAGRAGRPWKLVYGGRTRASMAFLDELAEIGGGTLHVMPQDECGLPDVAAVLSDAGRDAPLYCCGPEAMLVAVEETARKLGRAGSVHMERFSAPLSPAVDRDGGGRPVETSTFEVELRRSGLVLSVPPDKTILETVRACLPDVPSSCEEGYCGACEVRVVEGQPDHRDVVLSEHERAANTSMFICVSRSHSPRLTLDL